MINARQSEPQNLTREMAAQLDVVAEQHNGKVPLHGRLFSQWLHYAFPHECPYPQPTHEAVNYLLTTEYQKRTGKDSVLTLAQIKEYIKEHDDGGEPKPPETQEEVEDWADTMSQWTMEEELYVGHHHQGPRVGIRGSGAWFVLSALARLGVVAGGFVALRPLLVKAYQNFRGVNDDGEKKADKKGLLGVGGGWEQPSWSPGEKPSSFLV